MQDKIQDIDKLIPAKAERPIRVGITQGDTNGVGYELIFKTFADSELLELFTPIVYGHVKVATYHRKALGLNTPFTVIKSVDEAVDGQLNFVNVSDDEIKVEFGKLSPEAGHAAYMALEQVVSDVKDGKIDVVVTAPINKASIQSSNFHFLGQIGRAHV